MSASSDGRDFETRITADPAAFQQAMQKAAGAAADASKQIDAQFKKIGDTVTNVNKVFMGLTAVLAGGGALKKFITDANEWNATAGRMAAQLGITTQQASVMNTAMTRLGIDSETYVSASQKLSKQIQSNGEAFDVLGVSVRDTTGAYRPVTEVMGEVNAKLAAIKNPIEQNIAGQQVYGKGWAEVRGIMRLTSEQMAAAEVKARQLGLIVGPEGVALSKQYTLQMNDLKLVGKSIEIQFGNALLPVFTKLGGFMSREGPAAGQIFARVLEGVGTIAASVWIKLTGLGRTLGGVAAAAAAVLRGDFAGARSIIDDVRAQNQADAKKVEALWGDFGKAPPSGLMPDAPKLSDGPKYKFKEKGAGGTDAADKSRMPMWEAALAEQKSAIERQGLVEDQYREMSKAQEKSYWQQIKGMRGLSDAERLAASRKVSELEMAEVKDTFERRVAVLQAEAAQYKNNTEERLRIEREIQSKYQEGTKAYEESQKRINEIERLAAEQHKHVAQMRVDAQRESAVQLIALQEQQLQAEAQAGLLSQQQVLQAQQQFEQQRFDIAQQALQQRLDAAQADPDRNPVEVERVHREVEQLEQQHQLRMNQIKLQLQQVNQSGLQQGVQGIAQGVEGIVQRIGTQIRSLSDLWKAGVSTILQVGLQMLAKLAAQWVAQQLAMKFLGKGMTLSKIAEEAAKAGAGGVASMAAAPFPLNLGAPEFGAEMAGAALAFAPAASAAGGYDIPGSVNPVVQAHAREMVLPQPLSDGFRQIIAGLGGGGVAGGGRGDLVLQGHHMSGGFFMAHRDDLLKAFRTLQREFKLPGA